MLKFGAILISACFLSACLPAYDKPSLRLSKSVSLNEYIGINPNNQFKDRFTNEAPKEHFKDIVLNELRENTSKHVYYGAIITGFTGYHTFNYFKSAAGGSFKYENFKFSGEIGKSKPGQVKMDMNYKDVFKDDDKVHFSIKGDINREFEVRIRWSIPFEKLF